MSKKKGPHKHSHNLDQEVLVARAFWIVIVLYFFLEVFLKLSDSGLFSMRVFQPGGFGSIWGFIAQVWGGYLKPIFVTLDVILAGVFIFAYFKVRALRPSAHAHAGGHGASHGEHGPAAAPAHNPMILKHWTDIVRRANTGSPENLRWAIMESDALVDTVLKERQMPGETMADRLANFRREDSKHIDKLWDAHRLRNEIAHTPGFKMNTRQAEKALFAYRDFLKELKAF